MMKTGKVFPKLFFTNEIGEEGQEGKFYISYRQQ